MDSVGKAIRSEFESLQTERRNSWDWRIGEAFRWTMPERGIPYINQTRGKRTNESDLEQARRLQSRILDTTALDSVNTLARSLYQGATPPHSMWFDLTLDDIPIEDLTQAERQYFDNAARIMHSKIHGGNYNSTAMEIFLDYVAGGMVGVYLEVNQFGELYVEYIPMFNIYVKETLKKGRVDTVYRLLPLTLRAAAAQFGLENLPPDHRQKYRDMIAEGKDNCEEYDYIHCVRPRIGKDGKQVPFVADRAGRIGRQRWESIYICRATGHVISNRKGFDNFPFIIPRWRRIPESAYALGPLNDAIPDIKSLNSLCRQMFQANETAIAPPLKIKHDGVINVNASSISPGSLIRMQDTNNLQPLITGTRYDIQMGEVTRMQANIRRLMLAQELDPISKSNPTAYETDRYYEIMRQRLGPAYNVLHDELIQPFLQRAFALLYAAGIIPQNAPERIKRYLDSGYLPCPEFKSPLARAGRIEDIQAVDRVVAAIAGQREIFPDIADNFDSDEALRFYSNSLGCPAKLIKSVDAVKKLRKDKAKAEEQMLAQQQAMAAQAG